MNRLLHLEHRDNDTLALVVRNAGEIERTYILGERQFELLRAKPTVVLDVEMVEQ